MKAHRPRWPALGLALAMLAGALSSLAIARPAEARRLDQAAAPSSCAVDLQASALPVVLLAGETLELELELRATCPGPNHAKSVVLVLDASGSWLGQPIMAQKDAARRLVQRLDLPNNPSTRVGVVVFNSSSRTLCQLTNQVGRVRSCIGKLGAYGGTAIDLGIVEGLRVLRQGRNVPSGERITEILVVLTDGENNAGCDPVERAALQVKSQDVLVITVCVGPDCDAACMRAAASSDRDFLAIPDLAGLVGASDRIADRILGLSLRETSLRLELPEGTLAVDGSARPRALLSADRRQVDWQLGSFPALVTTATVQLSPGRLGFQPAFVLAQVDARDLDDRSVSTLAAPVYVTVFGFQPW